jgi:hypothetical protein
MPNKSISIPPVLPDISLNEGMSVLLSMETVMEWRRYHPPKSAAGPIAVRKRQVAIGLARPFPI